MSTYLRKLLITGGNGQLASSLRSHELAREFDITFCNHAEMDITNLSSIDAAIEKHTPDVIINTAAYTAVDKAEQESKQAMLVNHTGALQVAAACKKHKIPLIHISTDYVFDGMSKTPYCEDDHTHPVSVYGKSKWLGEVDVRDQCEQHIILRVSGVYSEYGVNFVKTMLRLANEKKELRIVADQLTCPTYAGDIAEAIYSILKQPLTFGTFHYCNSPATSWYEFALAIINEARSHGNVMVEEVKAITTAEYPTAATRPPYSVLNCDKITAIYGIKQKYWKDAVKKVVAKLILEKA